MRSQTAGLRPGTSLSEHVAREIERDYPGYLATHNVPRLPQARGPLKLSARGIKRFVFTTAGGVKRVSVATGRKSVNVNRKFGRSVKRLVRWAYDEWSYPTRTRKKSTYSPSCSILILVVSIHPAVVPSPILFTIPEILQTRHVSPLSVNLPETPTPVDVLPPTLNPAASIDDILRHYGVQPTPVRTRIPPPPARAIFPSEYRTTNLNRVHIRHRPRTSHLFSRSSARSISRGHTRFDSSISVASHHST
jgi:hypothetical protein